MLYAKVVNGVVEAFPYTAGDLRVENPNVSFPSDITATDVSAFNVVRVTRLADPTFNPRLENLVEGTPVLNVGVWEVRRVVVPASAEEIADRTKAAELAEDKVALKADAQVLALLTARPAAINNYIETNVTNLAQAKDVLKILARAIAVVASNTLN